MTLQILFFSLSGISFQQAAANDARTVGVEVTVPYVPYRKNLGGYHETETKSNTPDVNTRGNHSRCDIWK